MPEAGADTSKIPPKSSTRGGTTSSAAEREKVPLSWWVERLSGTSAGNEFVFGAIVDGALAGAAGLRFELREKLRHKALLFGMYVRQPFREHGLGRRLIETVLDAIAVLLIVTPIVLPTLAGLGIDRIHFGIVLIVNMEIAFLTPPIGLNLFVLSSIAKAPLAESIRGVAPFVALMFLFLLIVMSFPELSLWLPSAVYD